MKHLQAPADVSRTQVEKLLQIFDIRLKKNRFDALLTYLELLLRWNQRVNLTAIRDWQECVTRHFAESLYLAECVKLSGRLLDIGSGAGFPGLALKLVAPDLSVTLLEPVAKKRAFLNEVARACGFGGVEVRPGRLADFAGEGLAFDVATTRGVSLAGNFLAEAASCLTPEGLLCLWTTGAQVDALNLASGLVCRQNVAIPLSEGRRLWIGQRCST